MKQIFKLISVTVNNQQNHWILIEVKYVEIQENIENNKEDKKDNPRVLFESPDA